MFAIADGIGGTEGGDVASSMAISTLKDILGRSPEKPLRECFAIIREKLATAAKADQSLSQMGTTLSVCIAQDNNVHVGHVGDSRVYHLRGQGIMDRTKDQTEIQKLIDQGVLTKARAKKYHRKHILLSALTAKTDYEFYENQFSLNVGDRIILLTDGVYNLIARQEIKEFSVKSETPDKLASSIKGAVEALGAEDDYTAICAEVVPQ